MEKFYLLHGTKSEKSLYEILKTGYLLSGNNVDKKYRMHGGEDTNLKEIFFNIQFDDIKNIDITFPCSLIFHPKLLSDYNFTFGKGWGYQQNFVKFEKNDTLTEYKSKLRQIRKYLKNPDLPGILKTCNGVYQHELFTTGKISLKKYLVGVICYTDDNKIIKKLEKLISPDIPIFMSNIPPSYNDVIKIE